ncbi:MAG: AI-2E family transporter [Thioalkalivibrionaceae bacterium]
MHPTALGVLALSVTVVVLGGLVWLLAPVLTPFLAAALLAYLFDPVVTRLNRLSGGRLGRVGAAIILLLLVLFAIVIALLVLIPLVLAQIENLVQQMPAWLERARAFVEPRLAEWRGVDSLDSSVWPDATDLAGLVRNHWQDAGGMAGLLLGWLGRSSGALFGVLMNLVLIPVILFYLLVDWPRILRGAGALLPAFAAPTVVAFLTRSDEVLGAFLRGQLLVMIALGTTYAVALSLLGLELGIAIGVVAGLVSFIPYVGVLTGIVLALAAALFQGESWMVLVAIAAVFAAAQLLEQVVLTPWLVGDRTGLHPVAVIFAVLAGGSLFGFFGVLLALPVAAVIAVAVAMLLDAYRRAPFGPGWRDDDAEPDEIAAANDSIANANQTER